MIDEKMLTPGEVAKLFRVDPRTVGRWALGDPPRISSIRTPGGHRRYPAREVQELIRKSYTQGMMAEKLRQLDQIVGKKP